MTTNRKKLEASDDLMDIIEKMSEGIPGAISVITRLLKEDDGALAWILGLDDMNIRGSQIWIAYKNFCKKDLNKLIEAVKIRSPEMVKLINEMNEERRDNGPLIEQAVVSGASWERLNE